MPKRRRPDLADRQHAAVEQTLTAHGTSDDPTAEVFPTNISSAAGHEITAAEVDNALLRGALFLTARALQEYQASPRKTVDVNGTPMLQVTIAQSLHDKAEVLERADKMLKNQGRDR